MQVIDTQEAISSTVVEATDFIKETLGNEALKTDEWTYIKQFADGQSITIHPTNDDDGERTIHMDVIDNVFVGEKSEAWLDIFNEEEVQDENL
jgi:aromatic ring-cleaving dioxygenase